MLSFRLVSAVRRTLFLLWTSPSWPVAGITLLAAGLRLFHIDIPPIWTDEAFSLWVSQHSLGEVLRWVAPPEGQLPFYSHPPLYYVLLNLWLVFGDHEAAVRLLSVVSGALTIPFVYLLGRTMGGHRLGLLVALLMAVSPFNVQYGQEARMYSLLTLFAAMSMVGLAQLLRSANAADVPMGTETRAWWTARQRSVKRTTTFPLTDVAWAVYIAGTTAALWTHHVAVFLFVAENLIVVFAVSPTIRRRGFWRNWAHAQLAVALLWAPVMIQLVRGLGGASMPSVLLAPLALTVLRTVRALLAAHAGYLGIPRGIVDFVYVGLVGLGLWGWRREHRWVLFSAGLVIVPFGIDILVSQVWQHVLVPYTLIWMTIPLLLLVARGVMQLRRPILQTVALAVLLGIDFSSLPVYYWAIPGRERANAAADYVAQHAEPDDLILFNDNFTQLAFDYYFRRYHRSVAEHGLPVDFYTKFYAQEPVMRIEDLPVLVKLIQAQHRIWLISEHAWLTDPDGLIPVALSCVAEITSRQVFSGHARQRWVLADQGMAAEPITVYLYERPSMMRAPGGLLRRPVAYGGTLCRDMRGWVP